MDDAGEWVLAVLSQSSLHSFKLSPLVAKLVFSFWGNQRTLGRI
jgi:hypothetical protein